MPIEILLADDSEVIRRGIRKLLAESDIEVVAEASNFAQTIQLSHDLKPQVIIMDLHMPDESHFTPQVIVSKLNHDSRLLAISFSNDEDTRFLAENFGARLLLDKMELARDLVPAITRLALPKNKSAAA